MAGHEGFGDQRAHGIAVRAADDGRLEIVAGGRGGGRLRKEAQKGGRLAADAAARDDACGERGTAQRVEQRSPLTASALPHHDVPAKRRKARGPQQTADHESARTTGLYDRRNDSAAVDEVERIAY